MATWVPEKDRDTTYYIFKRLFKCRIPYIQTRTADDIRERGMPTSGDPIIDKQMANELVMRMIPIATMADLFSKGAEIRVVNPSDCEEIYRRITDHLLAWKNYLENSLTGNRAPLDDLVLLDELAQSIYPHAKSFFRDEAPDSVLQREFFSIDGVTRDNILTRPKNKVVSINVSESSNKIEEEEKEEPAYPSMGETFKRRLDERKLRESGAGMRNAYRND